MATYTEVQLAWGTAAEIEAFTGKARVPVWDETNKRLVVMEGTAPGAKVPLATESYVDKQVGGGENFVGFSANKNAVSQTGIPSATATKISFPNPELDIGGYYNSTLSRWWPPAGVVRVNINVLVLGGVVDQEYGLVLIYKNGILAKSDSVQFSGTQGQRVNVSAMIAVDGSDYIEAYFQASGAGDKTVSGSLPSTFFQGESLQVKAADRRNNLLLPWGDHRMTGYLAGAPVGISYAGVAVPSGATPTESDLASHRFRHCSVIAEHNGRVWVAHCSSGTNEAAGGTLVVVNNSLTSSLSFGALMLAVPAQSTFAGDGASMPAGGRLAYPRIFVKNGGKLYLVAAIDGIDGSAHQIGLALVARECLDDGTLGPLFRISAAAYTPLSGFPAIAYDATLGPPLSAIANVYGGWGGSYPDYPATDWIGWTRQDGIDYCEPTTIDYFGNGSRLVRLWRRIQAPNTRLWISESSDGGATWSTLKDSGMPNAPSATDGIRLADGRIVFAGNLMGDERDPLYLAVFSEGKMQSLKAVRQAVSLTPVYPGTAKHGMASYPRLWAGASDLWVSFSRIKEQIQIARIPLSSV